MKRLIIITSFILFSLLAKANHIEAGDAVLYVADNLAPEDFNEDLEIYIGLIEDEQEDLWIVVADPSPYANWGHRVIWHYIPCNSEDGNPIISKREDHDWLPNDVELVKFYHRPQPEMASYNLFTEREVPIRNISPAIHQYAIILSGGLNRDNDHPRYWNDCSYIYRILRNHFNVPKDQIFVAMSGGPERASESNNTSHSLDLDGDKNNDIHYAASIEDLDKIFSILKDKLTSADHLFFYVIDHGGYDAVKKSSFICLWKNKFLYPDKLNEWFNNLNVASINCLFGQCHSGGFIEPLKQPNRIITTACKIKESSYADSDKIFDTFVDTWASGLLNCTSLNNVDVDPADTDNDGYINMMEAFTSQIHMTQEEHMD